LKPEIKILILEDEPIFVDFIVSLLKQAALVFSTCHVDNKEAYLREIKEHPPDLILSDYYMPLFDGFAALEVARRECPDIPFIFVTGMLGEEVAIESLKNGATDYVLKNRIARLVPAVLRALREAEEHVERKRAEARLRESHEQLHALSVYLQYMREEERTRISRAVHDELGQALTGLKMDLVWLAGRLPKELKPLQEKAKAMAATVDGTVKTVRQIATDLRPSILDDLGLAAAIEWQSQEFRNRTGIECVVNLDTNETLLDQDTNTAFFRIFQETLTNIVRHAHATRVEITLKERAHLLSLEVKDNGRGITEAEIHNTKSIGLLGMHERAALLGGTFAIHGSPGQGTTVTVTILAQPMMGGLKREA
jgi:signal transduction histidine kinase